MPLEPGTYKLTNAKTGTVLGLSSVDHRTVAAWASHSGNNQKWEFAPLGAGFSIRSKFDGLYLTVDSRIDRGVAVIGSIYPACWALEPDDFDKQVWRVAWPNAPLLVGIADNDSKKLGTVVQLSNRYPFEPSCRWRLARCPPSASGQSENAPTGCVRSPSIFSSDTVVDAAEAAGEEEDGTITTTTTTTTSTTVTKVVRMSRA